MICDRLENPIFDLDDQLFLRAVAVGCAAEWQDSQYVHGWQCGCPDLRHTIAKENTFINMASLAHPHPEAK